MKIVGKDNHDRESVADILWLDNIAPDNVALARRVCDKLNEHLGDHVGTFFTLVEDDYHLSRGIEDLV